MARETILITGATSGIGRPPLGRSRRWWAGCSCMGLSRWTASRVWSTILRARLGAGASPEYLQTDYGRLAEVVRLAGQVVAATHRVDVVINNAARPGAPTWTGIPDVPVGDGPAKVSGSRDEHGA